MATHDLDALASGPLEITLGGDTYSLMVTVETMMRLVQVDAAHQDQPENQWELIMVILEEAGFPRDEFKKLESRQATRLSELITGQFFPEAKAEAEAKAAALLSSGPTPSPPSSDTLEVATPLNES